MLHRKLYSAFGHASKYAKVASLVILLVVVSAMSVSAQWKAAAVAELRCHLGEGAIWNNKLSELAFIDIEKGILYRYTPHNQSIISTELGSKVGTVVPLEYQKGYAVATQQGIVHLTQDNPVHTLLAHPETDKSIRYNDGKCDPAGRFYVGTMALNGARGKGSLYLIDSMLNSTKVLADVTISNGLVWSANGSSLYYIDTPTRKVAEYKVDSATGTLLFVRDAIVIAYSLGYPDGSTIDADGNIWIAMWGGASVTCWNPESGTLLHKVDVPALNVTSCAFGGENLNTLYITTASVGIPDDEKNAWPEAGKLFAVQLPVKGVPANSWKIDSRNPALSK